MWVGNETTTTSSVVVGDWEHPSPYFVPTVVLAVILVAIVAAGAIRHHAIFA